MKTISMLVLAIVMMLSAPMAYAGEHGGSEHGGSSGMEGSHGSHGMEHKAGGAVETLMEAAMELKASNPELAAKLKALAHEM